MYYLEIAIKLIVGLSILNVWLLNYNKSTQWRGGDANSMKEEFHNYGLSTTTMKIVGTLKVIFALLLMVSIFYSPVEMVAAYGIAILMLGAIGMHLKISDPIKKSFPAFLFLVLSVVVTLI